MMTSEDAAAMARRLWGEQGFAVDVTGAVGLKAGYRVGHGRAGAGPGVLGEGVCFEDAFLWAGVDPGLLVSVGAADDDPHRGRPSTVRGRALGRLAQLIGVSVEALRKRAARASRPASP